MTRQSWLASSCAQVLIVSLCALITAPLGAAETECDPQDPEKCSTPLRKGETAPYDCQALSPRLALDLGLKAHFCQNRIDLELKFAKKSADLVLSLEQQVRGLEKESWERQKTLLLERLEEAQHISWYERPAVIITVTVVATVLLFWGARETLKTW